MLYDKKSVSPQEYDEVKTRLAAAQARRDATHAGRTQAEAGVSQAGTAMSYTKVRAPFDGIVIAKLAEPGAMAAPGVPLLVVEDPSRFRLEAQVDESKNRRSEAGRDRSGDRRLSGRATHRGQGDANCSDGRSGEPDVHGQRSICHGIRKCGPGCSGECAFRADKREAIEIPKTAVLSRGQMQAVYVIGGDQLASLRFVTLGAGSGNQVEVLSGLQNGDRIVTQPGDRELSGKQVEAQ